MARNNQRRQKKLEKKRMERKTKLLQTARAKSRGVAAQLTLAANWPLHLSLMTEGLEDEGISTCLIVRRSKEGTFAISSFLVDTYCLGVKEAWAKVVPGDLFDSFKTDAIENGRVPFEAAAPGLIRKLVEQSVAYARQFGIEPHRDYSKAALIFGDINANACLEEFEFGDEGVPHYIAGPVDGPNMQREIIAAMEKVGGKVSLVPGGTRYGGINLDLIDESDFDDDDDFENDEFEDDEDESQSVVLETTYRQHPQN